MSDEEFKSHWLVLDRRELDFAWFASLQDFYRNCSAPQRAELQARLGWSDESCREPDNIFAANIGDRIRPCVRNEDSFRSYVLVLANDAWLQDYRDTMCDLAVLYPVAILRGFDIDQILESVAQQSPAASANTIRSFVSHANKDLDVWELRASRDSSRHIQIEHL